MSPVHSFPQLFRLIAILLGATCLPASAAIVLQTEDPHATGPTHGYQGEDDGGTRDSLALSFAPSTAHLASDSRLQFTVSAPAGQMFSIQTSPAYPDGHLYFFFSFNGNLVSTPFAPVSNLSMTFETLAGTPPAGAVSSITHLPLGTGSQISGWAHVYISAGVSFTGFTFALDYDNTGMTDTELASLTSASLDYVYQTFDNGDPGPLLKVLAIPEPATVSMVGLIAFAGLMMRIRAPGSSRSPSIGEKARKETGWRRH